MAGGSALPNAEVAVRGEYGVLQGKLNTPGGALLSRGGIPGVGLDGALVVGNWRLSAGGDWLSGHVDAAGPVRARLRAAIRQRPGFVYGAGIRGAGCFGNVVVDLGLFWERAKLPWVSLAVLGGSSGGSRTGSGRHPTRPARELDLHLRVKVAAGVFVAVLRPRRADVGDGDVRPTPSTRARRDGGTSARHTQAQFTFGLGIIVLARERGSTEPGSVAEGETGRSGTKDRSRSPDLNRGPTD